MAYFPSAQLNAGIGAMFTATSTTYYSSLHTASPGTTGANEVTGGSYARQATIFGTASAGVMSTTDAQNFTSMPAVTVTHFGEWSAVTSGTWLGGGQLSASIAVPSGATVSAAIGALHVSLAG